MLFWFLFCSFYFVVLSSDFFAIYYLSLLFVDIFCYHLVFFLIILSILLIVYYRQFVIIFIHYLFFQFFVKLSFWLFVIFNSLFVGRFRYLIVVCGLFYNLLFFICNLYFVIYFLILVILYLLFFVMCISIRFKFIFTLTLFALIEILVSQPIWVDLWLYLIFCVLLVGFTWVGFLSISF